VCFKTLDYFIGGEKCNEIKILLLNLGVENTGPKEAVGSKNHSQV
jgi:hypothetical protein